MIRFLCGCTSKIEIPIHDAGVLATFDSIMLDDEGFIMCKIHHARRYGWRTPNHSPLHGGMSDYQYERLTVWGERIPPPSVNFKSYDGPDQRPIIYERLLDAKAIEAIAKAKARQLAESGLIPADGRMVLRNGDSATFTSQPYTIT